MGYYSIYNFGLDSRKYFTDLKNPPAVIGGIYITHNPPMAHACMALRHIRYAIVYPRKPHCIPLYTVIL